MHPKFHTYGEYGIKQYRNLRTPVQDPDSAGCKLGFIVLVGNLARIFIFIPLFLISKMRLNELVHSEQLAQQLEHGVY